jgi:hypothetical protein
MFILTLLSLLATIIFLIFAIIGKRMLYWGAAASIYIFSFLSGFSIGQLTVGLTFVFLALAIGYTFKRINRKSDFLSYTAAGILIGVLIVLFVDDYWTFLPFGIFYAE